MSEGAEDKTNNIGPTLINAKEFLNKEVLIRNTRIDRDVIHHYNFVRISPNHIYGLFVEVREQNGFYLSAPTSVWLDLYDVEFLDVLGNVVWPSPTPNWLTPYTPVSVSTFGYPPAPNTGGVNPPHNGDYSPTWNPTDSRHRRYTDSWGLHD